MDRFKRRQCFKSKARGLPEIPEFERIFYIIPGVHIANLHHPGAYRWFKQRRNLRGESRQQFRLQRRLDCKRHSGSHFVHGPLLNSARPPLRLSLKSAILILHSRRKNRNSERSTSQAHRTILLPTDGKRNPINQLTPTQRTPKCHPENALSSHRAQHPARRKSRRPNSPPPQTAQQTAPKNQTQSTT